MIWECPINAIARGFWTATTLWLRGGGNEALEGRWLCVGYGTFDVKVRKTVRPQTKANPHSSPNDRSNAREKGECAYSSCKWTKPSLGVTKLNDGCCVWTELSHCWLDREKSQCRSHTYRRDATEITRSCWIWNKGGA